MTSNLNNFISFLETLKSLSTIYGLRLQVKTRPHFRGDKEMTQVRNSFCYHNNIQMKIVFYTFFVIIYNISLFFYYSNSFSWQRVYIASLQPAHHGSLIDLWENIGNHPLWGVSSRGRNHSDFNCSKNDTIELQWIFIEL